MKILKFTLKLFLVIFLAAGILGGFFMIKGYGMYKNALAETSIQEMAEDIRDKASFIPLDAIPDIYIDAVIAVEDHRFYDHPGIDILAIGRALFNDLKAGSFVEGGSTITQQLAKNQFFTQEKSFFRKAAEIFMAFDMEKELGKDEILELYINSIYYGNGYYGIGEACQGYYGKYPSEMTLDECTLLAGIPNAPSVYSPTENPDLAKQRQRQVVGQMLRRGYLSGDTAAALSAAALPAVVTP